MALVVGRQMYFFISFPITRKINYQGPQKIKAVISILLVSILCLCHKLFWIFFITHTFMFFSFFILYLHAGVAVIPYDSEISEQNFFVEYI